MDTASMRPSLLLVAGLACNGPTDANQIVDAPTVDAPTDAEQVCPISGSGSVNGSVLGAEVAPVRVVRVTTTTDPFNQTTFPTIVFGETLPQDPSPCGNGLPSAPDDLIIRVSTMAIGSYLIGGGNSAVFHSEGMNNTLLTDVATGGTLEIESVDATCMNGTFTLTFDTGMVTGAFAASICP